MNPNHNKSEIRHSERGIALFIAIFTLLLITAIAAGMIMLTNTDTNISANFRDEQTAFFGAKAGIEEVRDRFRKRATNSLDTVLPTALPGTTNGVLYVLNPTNGETDTPWATNGSNYPDNEICTEMSNMGAACSGTPSVPAGSPWYTSTNSSSTYAASPVLAWKWARITVKTNKSASGTTSASTVDGTTTNSGLRVCWNGTNQVTTAASDCQANSPVFLVTSLAVTPSGSRRMVQYEVVRNINIPVVAAIYAKSSINTGQALNVTGATDSVCSMPSTYGAASGTSTVTTPGGGNVTGSPAGTVNNLGWSVNTAGLISSLSSGATSITTVPGITSSGSPPNYSLTSGTLGTAPTVTYTGSDNISAITAPGTPAMYVTPDLAIAGTTPTQYSTLTLGGAGSGISGQGVLIVRGNLTMDFGQAWSYFGLIIVQGNLTMINTGGGNANPRIHGGIIVGGTMAANGTGMGNFNGSISIHQNACMVQDSIMNQYYKTVAVREQMF